jgi:hypothetical protein
MIAATLTRRSPENSTVSETTGCPSWCRAGCTPDQADGHVYHVSAYRDLDGVPDVDIAVSRLDDEDTGPGTATVDLFVNRTAADLTPAQARALAGMLHDHADTLDPQPPPGLPHMLTAVQALALAEELRERALLAARPRGVEMPVELVRLGDQILTPDGWETVEIHDVDGWLKPEVAHHAVRVNTDTHTEDDQAYRYPIGTAVRVRAGGAR